MKRHPVTFYVISTYAWSWLCWLSLIHWNLDYSGRPWKLLYILGLSGPLFAALLVSFVIGGIPEVWKCVKGIFIWRVSLRWYGLAMLFAPISMIAAWAIALPFGDYNTNWSFPSLYLVASTFAWMAFRGGPANEEFGWRGFLLPHLLARYNPFWATMILAPLWATWHIPLWFLTGIPHPSWPLSLFVLLVFSMSFLFTWLYCKTRGSVLLPVLFHTAINTSFDYVPIFPPRHPSLVAYCVWVGLCWAFTFWILFRYRDWWFQSPSIEVHERPIRKTFKAPAALS
jgi:hypothetical protein